MEQRTRIACAHKSVSVTRRKQFESDHHGGIFFLLNSSERLILHCDDLFGVDYFDLIPDYIGPISDLSGLVCDCFNLTLDRIDLLPACTDLTVDRIERIIHYFALMIDYFNMTAEFSTISDTAQNFTFSSDQDIPVICL